MARIVLDGVTKTYGGVPALENANLVVENASFTSVFGPPGCGKSVLLRLLLGLESVDSGRILIDDVEVTRAQPKERNFSMVFQNLALFPHLNARDNIAFPLVRRGTSQNVIDERLDSVAGVLSISHILHKKPAALSGGERQRVAIGRALVRDATAYLMDEPIAALDARLRDVMRVELKRLQSEFGHTFVYVTHDNEEAMSVADRMAILERGRIRQIDKPDTIYAEPSTISVAELVGSPKINILPVKIDGTAITAPFGSVDLEGSLLDKLKNTGGVVLGVRPEAVKLHSGNGNSETGAALISDIERLGGFSIVTMKVDEFEIRALADGDPTLAIGEEVSLRVDAADCHFFGEADGARII
ncbi:MAG: ABC transporter ATP-binding protein [Pseudomonadota bacterium]